MIIPNRTPPENKALPTTASVSARLIRIRRSATLLALALLMHCVALVSIWLTSLPLWLLFFSSALLFIHGGIYCHNWRRATSYRLQKNQAGCWVLYSEYDNNHFMALQHCYYWSRHVVILKVTDYRKHCYFYPVLFDSCHKNGDIDSLGFKHVRVLAKYLL